MQFSMVLRLDMENWSWEMIPRFRIITIKVQRVIPRFRIITIKVQIIAIIGNNWINWVLIDTIKAALMQPTCAWCWPGPLESSCSDRQCRNWGRAWLLAAQKCTTIAIIGKLIEIIASERVIRAASELDLRFLIGKRPQLVRPDTWLSRPSSRDEDMLTPTPMGWTTIASNNSQ